MGNHEHPSFCLPVSSAQAGVSVLLPSPAKQPLLFIPLLLGASSIATLLLYFNGVVEMGRGVRSILLPATALLVVITLWAKRTGRIELSDRILAGLWAGALATLAYDLVRVPIAHSGIPVFKAISYFGTVILGQPAPTVTSEVVGWAYHLSNGVGFGLMYAALVSTPRWWTAVLWGLLLEGAMLVTPYAEVFGYRVSPQFLAITVGAHIVYGVTLWIALRYWLGGNAFGSSPKHRLSHLILTCAMVPLGIGITATDFHLRYRPTLSPSPPGYLGPHLYTTWAVLEPDRIAALWVLQRFIDPQARFHFVSPFSHIAHGTPFDTPEAVIRRSGARSATEVLLAQSGLEADERLGRLARMANLYEITPWRLPSDPRAQQLGQELMAAGRCAPSEISHCVAQAFRYLDTWYARGFLLRPSATTESRTHSMPYSSTPLLLARPVAVEPKAARETSPGRSSL